MGRGAAIAHAGQRLLGYGFDRLYVTGRRYAVYDQTDFLKRNPEPDQRATGFDWAIYQLMVSDRARMDDYRRDIRAFVASKRVLEIGPGPSAVLTLIAAEAGAASIVSIEANDWAAAEARRRVRHFADRVRIVTGHTDAVSIDAIGPERHFDVLMHESYHSVASQERVIETIAGLRRRGITFDAVISRGFTTYVAPAASPTSASMTVVERVLMGWPPGRVAADAAMAERRSTLHGDMGEIASRRLAPAQVWQRCDFEAGTRSTTAGSLRFSVERLGEIAGLQFFNQFAFHHGDLDTARTPTHWGVYFVPLTTDIPVDAGNGSGDVEVRTSQPDATRPSVVELSLGVSGIAGRPLRL